MNFDDLPKGIKEEIWNRLDKNEYNKMRFGEQRMEEKHRESKIKGIHQKIERNE